MKAKQKKELASPKVLKVARRVVRGRSICDNCLGRQLGQVSTGTTNLERGRLVRKLLKLKEPVKCSVCNGLFGKLDKWVAKVERAVRGLEFSTFVVGCSPGTLLQREEDLWEQVGIEYCEPLKSEVNREVGKMLEKKLRKKASLNSPDIVIFLQLDVGTVQVQVRSLFVYGKYKKLVRGIPQTKWSTYKITVEDIVAKPLMKASGAGAHAFHGAGREDIDARCLDWRPFILELSEPRKRKLQLKKLEAEINRSKKVQVTGLMVADKREVVRLKESRPDKTYRLIVEFSKPVPRGGLGKLKNLVGVVKQKTPLRVMHRRADLLRERRVKEIKGKLLNKKKAILVVKGEAGLYVKELVTGDEGRTHPSVAEIIGPAKVKELDVIKIHLSNKS